VPNPPGRVGRKLGFAAPVVLVDGLDEAQGALLDQVEQVDAAAAVRLRDRDDEPEVGLDQPLARAAVAGLDALGELNFLRPGEERVAADLREVRIERVLCECYRHGSSFVLLPGADATPGAGGVAWVKSPVLIT
jgi:hypothetical protein